MSSTSAKEIIKTMITCTRYREPCKLMPQACAERYRKASKTTDGRISTQKGWVNLDMCLGCEIGRKNSEKHPKPIEKKVEKKQCPCGEWFERPDQTGPAAWSRMTYCEHHRAMHPVVRKKDIERIKSERKNGTGVAVLEEALEESMTEKAIEERKVAKKNTFKEPRVQPPTAKSETAKEVSKNDSLTLPLGEEGIDWKHCQNKKCGMPFPREEGVSEFHWDRQKYCSLPCRYQGGLQRDRERRAEKWKAKKTGASVMNMPDIVAQVWESWEVIIGHMFEDPEPVKDVCFKIAEECLRRGGVK